MHVALAQAASGAPAGILKVLQNTVALAEDAEQQVEVARDESV